jgi:hypothetical protein
MLFGLIASRPSRTADGGGEAETARG